MVVEQSEQPARLAGFVAQRFLAFPTVPAARRLSVLVAVVDRGASGGACPHNLHGIPGQLCTGKSMNGYGIASNKMGS